MGVWTAAPLLRLVLAALAAGGAAAEPTAPAPSGRTDRGFLENAGQWPEPVRFHARRGGLSAWVTPDALWLDARRLRPAPPGDRSAARLDGTALRLGFEGAQPARVVGEGDALRRASFLAGGRAHHARARASVVWRGLWPGVDVRLREAADGALAYDLLLAPGADLARVVVRVDGAEGLALEPDGGLVLHTAHGPLRQSAPVAWTVGPDGATAPLAVRFRRLDERRFGFAAPARPAAHALVVDPGLEWSTYLGGDDLERVLDVAVGPAGEVLACGVTYTSAFPTTPGAYAEQKSGLDDAFVTCLAPGGDALVWSTYLGGGGADVARALAVDAAGAVTVVGDTGSADFPVTPGALDGSFGGGLADVFVARLAPDGATLAFSTFLGEAGDDYAGDVALAADGAAVVCGRTTSAAFPTTPGAFDTSQGGGGSVGDGFVARLAPDGGSLVWSSFLGGSGADSAVALALDRGGAPTVGGTTSSADFPTTPGAWDRTLDQTGGFGNDAFVARLAADGSGLAWSSYLGRDGTDLVADLVLGADGSVTVCGTTESTGLATPGALDTSYAGAGDAFVARLAADGTALEHASYLGGPGQDGASGLALDAAGRIAVTGRTTSPGFPTTVGALDRTLGSLSGQTGSDAFLVRLAPDADALDYGSFVGGREEDAATALARAGEAVVLGGWTSSFDFPTTPGAFDRTYDGSLIADGFVLRMDFAWHPQRYGQAKQNSNHVTPSVYTSGFPSAARDDFHIGLVGGIPFELGWLMQGAQPFDVPLFGGRLLVGPPFHRIGPLTLGFLGDAYVRVPYDRSLVGQTVYYQFWYRDPNDAFGVGWSDALEVLVYP